MAEEEIKANLTGDSRSMVKAFNDASWAASNFVKMTKTVATAVGQVEAKIERFGSKLTKIGVSMGTGLAGVGAGAGKLEASLRNVMTVADRSETSMGKLADTVTKMSTQLPQSSFQLADSLYEITSSGFQGADALKVLEASAYAASAGLTDTATSGRAISAILNAYGMSADKAAGLSDVLFQTVNMGVISFEELANTTGDWASIAATLGISVEEVSAALATMTLQGTNANEASTQVTRAMTMFMKPSEKMIATVDKLGFSSATAMVKELGFAKSVEMLSDAVGNTPEGIQEMFQSVEAVNGVLQMGAQNGKVYADIFDSLANPMQVAGATQRAFAEQSQGLFFQLKILGNQVTSLGLSIGRYLVPAATFAVRTFSFFVGGLQKVLDGVGKAKGVFAGLSAVFSIMAVSLGLFLKFAALKALTLVATTLATRFLGLGRATSMASLAFQRFKTSAMGATAVGRTFTSVVGKLQMAGAAIGASFMAGLVVMEMFGAAMEKGRQQAKDYITEITKDVDLQSFEGISQTIDQINAKQQELMNTGKVNGGGGWWGELKRGVQGAAELLTPLEDTILNTTGAYKELGEEEQRLISSQNNLRDNLDYLTGRLGLTEDEVLGLAKTVGVDLTRALQQVRGDDTKDWIDTSLIDQASTSIQGLVDENRKVPGSMDAAAEAVEKFGSALTTASERADIYQSVLEDALVKGPMGIRSATADAGDSLRDLRESFKENGFEMDAWTVKGGDLQEAMADVTERGVALAMAIYESTDSMPAANAALMEYAEGVAAAMRDAGANEEQIAEMVETMGLTPDNLKTAIELENVDPVKRRIEEIQFGLERLNAYVARPQVTLVTDHIQRQIQQSLPATAGAGIPTGLERRASGGPVRAGTTYLVGEKGPELFTAPASGHVFSAQSTKAMYDDRRGGSPTNAVAHVAANETKDSKKSSSGKSSSGKSSDGIKKAGDAAKEAAKKSAEAAKKALEELSRIEDYWYEIGVTGTDKYVEQLEIRLTKVDKFSDDWFSTMRAIQEATREHEDKLYELGVMGTGAYINVLKDRLGKVGMFTNEWLAIYHEAQDIQLQFDRRAYENGLMHTNDFLDSLGQRLAGLEKFSEAWWDVWTEIEQVTEESNEKILETAAKAGEKIIAQMSSQLEAMDNDLTRARQAWDEMQSKAEEARGKYEQDLQSFRDGIRSPMMEATNLVENFGNAIGLSAEDIKIYFDQYKDSVDEWSATIDRLKNSGLDRDLVDQLVAGGPQSQSLAEALLQMDPSEVQQYMDYFKKQADAAVTMFEPGKIARLENQHNVTELEQAAAAAKRTYDGQKAAYDSMQKQIEIYSAQLNDLTWETLPSYMQALGLTNESVGGYVLGTVYMKDANEEAATSAGSLANAVGTDVVSGINSAIPAIDTIGARVANFGAVAANAAAQGRDLANSLVQIRGLEGGDNARIPHFAMGGHARGLALVGENGPELVNFGSVTGTVYPHHYVRGMNKGGDGVTIQVGDINFNGVDPAVSKRDVNDMLNTAVRSLTTKMNKGVAR